MDTGKGKVSVAFVGPGGVLDDFAQKNGQDQLRKKKLDFFELEIIKMFNLYIMNIKYP